MGESKGTHCSITSTEKDEASIPIPETYLEGVIHVMSGVPEMARTR